MLLTFPTPTPLQTFKLAINPRGGGGVTPYNGLFEEAPPELRQFVSVRGGSNVQNSVLRHPIPHPSRIQFEVGGKLDSFASILLFFF